MYRLSHVSREYLTRMCRQHLGQTPSELINALRLEYAASELSTPRSRFWTYRKTPVSII